MSNNFCHGCGEPMATQKARAAHRDSVRTSTEFERHLSEWVQDRSKTASTKLYNAVIRFVEQALIERVLRDSGGNQLKAARTLGINRNTLHKKLIDNGLVHYIRDAPNIAADKRSLRRS